MLMTKVKNPATTKGLKAIRQNDANKDEGSRETRPTIIMPRFSMICAAALDKTVNRMRGRALVTEILSERVV
jgi:hypothetical protein